MKSFEHARILRRGIPLLVVLPILGLGAGVGYSALQTPQYESTASVYVAAGQAQSATDLSQGGSYVEQVVTSYADIARKPIILGKVISDLGLRTTAQALAGRVNIDTPLNTTVLEISVTDPSPAAAARIADSISATLVSVVPTLSPSTTSKSPSVKISPIESAPLPTSPVSPTPWKFAGLGFIAGLALAFGAAYLRGALDVRVRTVDDLRAVSEKPVLGTIAFNDKAGIAPLVMTTAPHGAGAESYRALRTNLQFFDFGDGPRSVVVTSSMESEGKSSIASNLAVAMSLSGERVVLIDADLRRPKLNEYFGMDGRLGLTDILIGRTDFESAAQAWGDGSLTVLPAGRIPPNPAELLQSHKMTELLERLGHEFDAVILDAPPLLPVTDAALLSRQVGGAIVVAAARKTNRNHLVTALDRVNGNVLGLVLSMVPLRGPESRYYGTYDSKTAADALPMVPATT